MAHSTTDLEDVFHTLLSAYGPQDWWPGETPFEVMVGAILTQNTSWTNVEKAILNLKQASALSLQSMLLQSDQNLADLIYPAGYFNLKAKRLKHLCEFLMLNSATTNSSEIPIEQFRSELLAVNGIGPETADAILLYAFDKPVFVIDAYTRRIFSRLGSIAGDEGYEQLRLYFQGALPNRVELFNEYHALIVKHAKLHCAKRPSCNGCVLRRQCTWG